MPSYMVRSGYGGQIRYFIILPVPVEVVDDEPGWDRAMLFLPYLPMQPPDATSFALPLEIPFRVSPVEP
jgi:hypothetical protein